MTIEASNLPSGVTIGDVANRFGKGDKLSKQNVNKAVTLVEGNHRGKVSGAKGKILVGVLGAGLTVGHLTQFEDELFDFFEAYEKASVGPTRGDALAKFDLAKALSVLAGLEGTFVEQGIVLNSGQIPSNLTPLGINWRPLFKNLKVEEVENLQR